MISFFIFSPLNLVGVFYVAGVSWTFISFSISSSIVSSLSSRTRISYVYFSLGIIIDFVAGFTHSGGLLYPALVLGFIGLDFLVFEFLESGF